MSPHGLRLTASGLRFLAYGLILVDLPLAVGTFVVSELLDLRAELQEDE